MSLAPTTSPLDGPVEGLRIGVVAEGFGIPDVSMPGVDDAVQSAIERLRQLGASVTDVSVPWHRDAMHVWNVIATEGATAQMVDGNVYGMNYQGMYDPELIAFYGRQWRERAARFSETVKLVVMAGRHAIDTAYGQHYRGANLTFELRRAYDEALADHDVLVMPTLPLTATPIPAPDAPRARVPRQGTGDDRQHGAVRRDGAPRVPRCPPISSTACRPV